MTENDNKPIGLHQTGHPLEDMGLATLTAFAKKKSPEELTLSDLEKFAEYAEDAYFTPALSNYLTIIFPNLINNSFPPEKKREFAGKVLRSFKELPNQDLPSCAYCGKPSIKLTYRHYVPMLTGMGIINFFPGGQHGLALCGYCITGLQALSIGAPKCSGRALIISSDSYQLTQKIISNEWLPNLRNLIQLSQTATNEPPKMSYPLTRVMETLERIRLDEIEFNGRDSYGLTVFHISNSGQGPGINIYELPSVIFTFVRKAQGANYKNIWNNLVQRAWERTKKGEEITSEEERLSIKNYLYEDLFALPEESARFIRRYFLRQAMGIKKIGNIDPRNSYAGWQDAGLIQWNLTKLFLKEVMGMEKERIEAIQELGDRLADEICSTNDKKLWWNIYKVKKSWGVRNILIRQSYKCAENNREPIVKFDRYLTIFEEGEELAKADWRLAWDLMLIRVIEQLYQKQWFAKNPELATEEENQNEEVE